MGKGGGDYRGGGATLIYSGSLTDSAGDLG